MKPLILQTATRFMMPLLLLFSVFLLVRGHNLPGGGFIGGLVATSAFGLYVLAFNVAAAREALGVDPKLIAAAGLLVALSSGVWALVHQYPYLTHRYFWTEIHLLGLGEIHLGTPFLFDVGVYLVVIGSTQTIIQAMAEE